MAFQWPAHHNDNSPRGSPAVFCDRTEAQGALRWQAGLTFQSPLVVRATQVKVPAAFNRLIQGGAVQSLADCPELYGAVVLFQVTQAHYQYAKQQ